MDQSHIYGQNPPFEQQRQLRKQHRRKVCPPLPDGLADVVTDEQRIDPQVPFHRRGHIISVSHCQRLADFHIMQFWSVFDQCGQQRVWHRAVTGHKDPLPRFYQPHGICRAHLMRLVVLSPVHFFFLQALIFQQHLERGFHSRCCLRLKSMRNEIRLCRTA